MIPDLIAFGDDLEEDDSPLCPHCHDYPCSCTIDDVVLHDDWDAEIDAHVSRNP